MLSEPIDKLEAARYMGVKGTPDEVTMSLLDEKEKLIRSTLTPKYVYRRTKIGFSSGGILLSGMNAPLTGNDIRRHLEGCTEAVVLAATLTADADKLIRKAAVSSAAESLAVDCLCSAAIEQVCNEAEKEIFLGCEPSFRTWRFSPGYGDLPIEIQPDILKFLNAQRRIGLTVSSSHLLIPTKSVTAIIGISDKVIHRGARGCEVCSMRGSCGISALGGCGAKK